MIRWDRSTNGNSGFIAISNIIIGRSARRLLFDSIS